MRTLPAVASAVAAAVVLIASTGVRAAADAKTGAKGQGGSNLIWSIGVYAGASPFELRPASGARNPVIIGADTGEPEVDTVAHPFLVKAGGAYHLFFTAKNLQTGRGGIGHAESSDGIRWQCRGLVLRESAVLSYPCVFQSQGQYYMVPESTENVVRLYRATRFPDQWQREADLVKAGKLIAPTVVQHNGKWWLFVGGSSNGTLLLYFANDLKGPWTEHPKSPIVKDDAHIARPAGRPLMVDGKLYRLGQDCIPTYGRQVLAFQVTTLTSTDYAEQPVEKPLIGATSTGWNSAAMHHVDALQLDATHWIAAVDARGARVR